MTNPPTTSFEARKDRRNAPTLRDIFAQSALHLIRDVLTFLARLRRDALSTLNSRHQMSPATEPPTAKSPIAAAHRDHSSSLSRSDMSRKPRMRTAMTMVEARGVSRRRMATMALLVR